MGGNGVVFGSAIGAAFVASNSGISRDLHSFCLWVSLFNFRVAIWRADGIGLKRSSLTWLRMGAIAGTWTLVEWSRLFVLCGFSWNPVGLALSGSLYSLQLAAVGGVYLLTFWVILTNLIGLKAWLARSAWQVAGFGVAACAPYLFGLWHVHSHNSNSSDSLSVALVQTALLPSEKMPIRSKLDTFIPPLEQWDRIFSLFERKRDEKWDLIVLPEAAVPFGADLPIYPSQKVASLFQKHFGFEVVCDEPKVSNAFLARKLGEIFQAEVIVGLDAYDKQSERNYNAAFHFVPGRAEIDRYDKRVLLPLAEYVPFAWLRTLTRHYGITDFFTAGCEAKIFHHKIPLSVSICYEETFAHLIREGRLKGAEVLVNLTNDNYYPNSRLPLQHFAHARLRAVENGASLVRACNTGVTGYVDSFGRLGAVWTEEWRKGVLSVKVPVAHHRTFFLTFGNSFIVVISCFLIFLFIINKFIKKPRVDN